MGSKNNDIMFKDIDRPLLIINDFTINGTTRFQKYGFLLHKEYGAYMLSLNERCNIEFYTDWEPLYFGPFSRSLKEDLKECMSTDVIKKVNVPTGTEGREMSTYNLTIKGRQKWRNMLVTIPEIQHVMERVQSMQKISYYILLGQIYKKYPEFTTNSQIRNEVAVNAEP